MSPDDEFIRELSKRICSSIILSMKIHLVLLSLYWVFVLAGIFAIIYLFFK